MDERAVDLEREEVSNHLQPRAPRARLRFPFARGIDEVEFRLFHEQAAHYLVMEEGVPLNGEIESPAREERNGHAAARLTNTDVVNRVSAAPEVDLDLADIAGIEGAAIKRSIDVVSHGPWEDRPPDAEEHRQYDQDKAKSAPTAMFA